MKSEQWVREGIEKMKSDIIESEKLHEKTLTHMKETREEEVMIASNNLFHAFDMETRKAMLDTLEEVLE